ncbi:hypothetical protein LCGC14_0527600 [marine sediment metagenome]|uniref:HTH cro/C1-type domain-containing protein n=1 Tax=marine sediment metagenome TaxID=412755 RepID=A0A0F9S1D7_9ZZZZ
MKKAKMTTKQLRMKLKLSQDRFAARLGEAPYTIRRWESGKHKPSPLSRMRIKEVFNVEL